VLAGCRQWTRHDRTKDIADQGIPLRKRIAAILFDCAVAAHLLADNIESKVDRCPEHAAQHSALHKRATTVRLFVFLSAHGMGLPGRALVSSMVWI
jgi:hypothetical protein